MGQRFIGLGPLDPLHLRAGFLAFPVQWRLKITIDVRPFRFELVAGLAVTAIPS
jgi:hypothetical protein